jgi:uncharacterized protein (DUF433 family)
MATAELKIPDLTLYGGIDPRDMPIYPIVDSASHLKTPLNTLRSWIRGRTYLSNGKKNFTKPLITLPDPNKPLLSFFNLIEAHVLHGMRHKHNISMYNIRAALFCLSHINKSPHPLAELWFQTDGVNILMEYYGDLINLTKNGQLEMREIIQAYLTRIDRDIEGVARRFFPFITREQAEKGEVVPKVIMVDPFICFGRPILASSGIPTAVIAEHYRAGDSISFLAKDYGCQESEIKQAIEFEERERKAA